MRQIKFRAWLKPESGYGSRMHYPHKDKDLIMTLSGTVLWQTTNAAVCKEVHFRNVVLMQFTGLTDKNGKDIYEGDIVDIKCEIHPELNRIGSIKWSQPRAAWLIDVDHWRPALTDEMLQYTIIGNIHENPELLES